MVSAPALREMVAMAAFLMVGMVVIGSVVIKIILLFGYIHIAR